MRLPLGQIIRNAFALSWHNRADLLGPLALPLLAVIACSFAWRRVAFQPPHLTWMLVLSLCCLAMGWLAITVHRLVLLDANVASTGLNAKDLRRLFVFTAVGVGTWITLVGVGLTIAGIIAMVLRVFSIPIYRVSADMDEAQLGSEVYSVTVAALALAAWLLSRLFLVFPAIALDRRIDIAGAWYLSRGNGWRLAIIAFVLPFTLDQVAGLLGRDGASSAEMAAIAVITAPLMVVEVVALSLSYQALTAPEPPPTPPPS